DTGLGICVQPVFVVRGAIDRRFSSRAHGAPHRGAYRQRFLRFGFRIVAPLFRRFSNSGMHISDFDYELPEELIAQHPLAEREASRMLIVDRATQTWHDSKFVLLPEYLRPNDVLVLNNTRVFPARLVGERVPTGGMVELLLLREIGPNVWEALTRPARRLRKGARITFGDTKLQAEVIECLNNGLRIVRFEFESEQILDDVIDELGLTPLPPYIKRKKGTIAE